MSAKQNQPANKILRIGVFQNKNCLEERLIHARKPVNVGQDFNDKKNTFVIPVSTIPRSFTVLDVDKDGKYVLRFTSEMTGRVSMADGKAARLQELIQDGRARKNGEVYELPVDLRTFGRVAFGGGGDEVAILFQFVKPPPPRSKPVLPASMRAGVMYGILGATTLAITTALSAVFQIGFVAFLLSRDWPQPRDIDYRLPDRFVSILVEDKKDPIDVEPIEPQDGEGPGEEEPEDEPSDSGPKEEEPSKEPKSAEERAAAEAERKARLAEEVKSKTILGTLGALSNDGATLVDALSEGAGRTSMEEAFAGSTGVTTNVAGAEKSGLRTSGSSAADGKGKAFGIGDLGKTSGARQAEGGVKTGTKTEKKVKVRVRMDSPTKTVGGTLDSNSISKALRLKQRKFQSCYEREVKKNPKSAGKVIVNFTIGTRGRVTAAKAITDSVGGGVGACVANAIKGIRFPPPSGGEVIVNKTFVFEAAQ